MMKKKLLCVVALMAAVIAMQAQEVKQMESVVKMAGGLGITTSKCYVANDRYYDNLGGLELDLGIERFWKNHLGFGMNANMNYTVKNVHLNSYSDFKLKYTTLYLGPCFAVGGRFARHFRIEGNIGLGLALFFDGSDESVNNKGPEIGIGGRLSFSVEYVVTERIGIGLELSDIISRYPGADKTNLPKNVDYGLDHVGLLLGIRVYSPFQ